MGLLSSLGWLHPRSTSVGRLAPCGLLRRVLARLRKPVDVGSGLGFHADCISDVRLLESLQLGRESRVRAFRAGL